MISVIEFLGRASLVICGSVVILALGAATWLNLARSRQRRSCAICRGNADVVFKCVPYCGPCGVAAAEARAIYADLEWKRS